MLMRSFYRVRMCMSVCAHTILSHVDAACCRAKFIFSSLQDSPVVGVFDSHAWTWIIILHTFTISYLLRCPIVSDEDTPDESIYFYLHNTLSYS